MIKMKFLVLFAFVHVVVGYVEFEFHNTLSENIWVGCQGNKNETYKYEDLSNGGWVLNSGTSMSITNVRDDWQGRFWGRTGCNAQTEHCLTGDCGNKLQCNGASLLPPATILEILLKDPITRLDYYDVSLVDGFNIPGSIEPKNGQKDGSLHSCKKTSCLYNILNDCPRKQQVISNGQVVACNSDCIAFKEDKYCCRNAYNTSETCKPTDWPNKFKHLCSDAYFYAFDDRSSTFTCKATKYLFTFGAR